MPEPAVIQALQALLPSVPATGKPFPPTLLSQSQSLLALSRQRHPNLKAEEEIARAHVCVEIACTRLRAPLRLPVIKNGAGAPCKPTVYRKLYKFLDTSLADAAVGPLTPKGTKRSVTGAVKETGGGGSARKTPVQRLAEESPSKSRILNRLVGTDFVGSVRSPGKKRKTKELGLGTDNSSDEKAPEFVLPAVRKLCRHLSTPSLVPHVYTGICVVLELTGLWTSSSSDDDMEIDQQTKEDILALLISLYLMVLTRMRKGKMTSTIYSKVSSGSIELLQLDDNMHEKIEEWIAKLKAGGWCTDQQWWDSVPEDVLGFNPMSNSSGDLLHSSDDTAAVTVGEGSADVDRGEEYQRSLKRFDLEADDPDGVLLPGLGTMLHAGNDWTSEEKEADFLEWKENILQRIESLDRTEGRDKRRSIAAG